MPTIPVIATRVEATAEGLILVVGRKRALVPWEKCSHRLANATDAQRRRMELSPGGYGVHWPLIDEDLSVGGLLEAATGR